MATSRPIRHSTALSIQPLSRRPHGAGDGWLDESVSYATPRWEVVVAPTLVKWSGGPSGVGWSVGVAVDATTYGAGVATLRAATEPGARPNLEVVDGGRIALDAVSWAATISFGPEGSRDSFWPLRSACERSGRSWVHYVRHVMSPAGADISTAVIPRRNAPDYRAVAEEYLAALEVGEHPVDRIMRRTDCPSRSTARKWVERAAAAGWLTTAAPVPGARRGPGPMLG